MHIARTAKPDRAKSSADGANADSRRKEPAAKNGRAALSGFRFWFVDDLFCFIVILDSMAAQWHFCHGVLPYPVGWAAERGGWMVEDGGADGGPPSPRLQRGRRVMPLLQSLNSFSVSFRCYNYFAPAALAIVGSQSRWDCRAAAKRLFQMEHFHPALLESRTRPGDYGGKIRLHTSAATLIIYPRQKGRVVAWGLGWRLGSTWSSKAPTAAHTDHGSPAALEPGKNKACPKTGFSFPTIAVCDKSWNLLCNC